MAACLSFLLLGSSAPLTLHSDIVDPIILSTAGERRPSSSYSKPTNTENQPTPSESPVLEYKRFSGFEQWRANLDLDHATQFKATNWNVGPGRRRRAGSLPLPVVHESWIGAEGTRGWRKRSTSEPISPSASIFGLLNTEETRGLEVEKHVPLQTLHAHSLSPVPSSFDTPVDALRLSVPLVPVTTGPTPALPALQRALTVPHIMPLRALGEEQGVPRCSAIPPKRCHVRSRAVSYPSLLRYRVVTPHIPVEPPLLHKKPSSHRLGKKVSFSMVDEIIDTSEDCGEREGISVHSMKGVSE